jgi:hypothetical protein
VLLEQNIGIASDITVRLMFMCVNDCDIGVHFACITKKPGLISVKTGADLAHSHRSSNASIHESLFMKVLVAVKRAIDPNVKVGVKGDVQVSTRMACKLPLTLCVVACERAVE